MLSSGPHPAAHSMNSDGGPRIQASGSETPPGFEPTAPESSGSLSLSSFSLSLPSHEMPDRAGSQLQTQSPQGSGRQVSVGRKQSFGARAKQ